MYIRNHKTLCLRRNYSSERNKKALNNIASFKNKYKVRGTMLIHNSSQYLMQMYYILLHMALSGHIVVVFRLYQY